MPHKKLMGKNKKKPYKNPHFQPHAQKQATALNIPDDGNQVVKWCFELFDREFCIRKDNRRHIQTESFQDVGHCLKPYSKRTWGDITKDFQRDHEISVEKITPAAQRRLEKLQLSDYTKLWSFRLTGLWRIWGIRNRNIFRVLWWDPEHQIYPTDKQNKGKHHR